MHLSLDFFSPLPECPSEWGVNKFANSYIAFPSSAFLCSIITICCIILACLISFKYNSVKVFNRKVRTQNISNTLWIIYFLIIACRNAFEAVILSLSERDADLVDMILTMHVLVFYGLGCFCLCLALNHQRRFRSSVPKNNTKDGTKESDPLIAKYDWCKRTFTGAEALFFFLLVVYFIFLYLEIVKKGKIFDILFLTILGIQRVPVIILMAMIISLFRGSDGPTKQSRWFLFIASILNITGDLPLNVWAYILPGNCVFVVASWVDFFHLFYLISLILIFLFVKNEYQRNMEETIWSTVSQIQDTFDFRKFEKS